MQGAKFASHLLAENPGEVSPGEIRPSCPARDDPGGRCNSVRMNGDGGRTGLRLIWTPGNALFQYLKEPSVGVTIGSGRARGVDETALTAGTWERATNRARGIVRERGCTHFRVVSMGVIS